MERDFGAEIDLLKEEIRQIKNMLVKGFLPPIEPKNPVEGKPVLSTDGSKKLNDLRDEILAYTADSGETGAIIYTGTFCSGNGESTRQSIWASTVPTDFLLKLNGSSMVEKVLTSVGNSQRLAILLALLKEPRTATQLVESLGSNTTGQVYHHLKPLIAADIVKEENGVYAVIPYRVQGILMLLAGVYDLTDSRYTAGTWEET